MIRALVVCVALIGMSSASAQSTGERLLSTPTELESAAFAWPFPRFGYSMSFIPLTEASAINNAGAIVGAVNGSAAIYQQGVVTLLQGKDGYTNLRALDISNTGYIVGTGESAGHLRALFWQSATAAPRDMGGLGRYMYPQSINDHGTVAGYFDATGASGFQSFTWSPVYGYTVITPSGASSAQAFGISNSGYIAGVASYPGIGQQAVRWYPNGAAGRITGPAYARRALENGDVFGRGSGGSTLWNLSNTPTLIGPEPAAHFVERRNDMLRWVGYTYPPNSRPWTSVDRGTATYLPMPLGAYGFANDVNACGTVLGSIVEANGTARPVYWSKWFCDSLPPIVAQ